MNFLSKVGRMTASVAGWKDAEGRFVEEVRVGGFSNLAELRSSSTQDLATLADRAALVHEVTSLGEGMPDVRNGS